MDMTPRYYDLVKHYDQCLEIHGATPKGVDWPNAEDLLTRMTVMLEILKNSDNNNPIELLDLGCGYGALLDFINMSPYCDKIRYKGIDLSSKMLEAAIERHHSRYFENRDILINKLTQDSFDYVVMNGLFTEKRNLSQFEMETFFAEMVNAAFLICRFGIAFNVMNFHVDWYREDLFHLSFDRLATIITQHCSRHFSIRADYGLYEYTVYVYKQPRKI